MDPLEALVILARAPLGQVARRRLLEQHGDAAAALRGGPSAWRAQGVRGEALAALARPDREAVAADLHWLQGANRRLLGWHDADYPGLLKRSEDPPAMLYLHGDASLLWHPQLAVVGSRKPTPSGAELAAWFAGELAAGGWTITSGLAEGIDASAHLAALARGRSVAVIATGPDQCYPRAHAALMERIAAEGLVVSEYPPGTEGRPGQFPARNRIIAGLSLGTLVVEAAQRSGALITARLAAQAGREVFAIPGSIRNPLAQGCHRLIRQGAALVETPAEVGEALAGLAQSLGVSLGLPPSAAGAATVDDPEQAQLLALMGFEPIPLDVLAERSGLTLSRLSAILLDMELEGRVRAEHGRYSRRA